MSKNINADYLSINKVVLNGTVAIGKCIFLNV